MTMRLELGLVLALVLAPPVVAEPADCAALTQLMETATGLSLTAPPAGNLDGWCVLDGVRSAGEGAIRVSAETLRVRGEAEGVRLVALEVEAAGLRVAPALNNRDMPDWLRDVLRLQSAELRLTLRRDEVRDLLLVERCHLGLSGGGELVLRGEVAGAELTVPSLLTGRVTRLYLQWLNDGRTLRPTLEAWGERLEPGVSGTKAVLAARDALQGVVEAMPGSSLADRDAKAVAAFIQALPQGRGRLILDVASDGGIGAVQLGLLALAENAASPEALARFLSGTSIGASWTPGIAP